MKKILFVLFVVFLSTMTINAQGSIAVFGGYGQSQFEDDLFGPEIDIDQSGFLPVGVQAGYSFSIFPTALLFVGVEINHALSPFTFELSDDIGNGDQRLLDLKINQTVIGGLVKIKFSSAMANPFIRLGAGLYSGNSEVEYSTVLKNLVEQQTGEILEDEENDIKSAFGFNVGGGVDYKIGSSNAVFLEFVYHIVTREPDEENTESFDANNWAVHIGYQLGLN